MKKILILFGLLLNVHLLIADSNPLSKGKNYQPKISFLENKGQMTDMDGKPVSFVLFKIEGPGISMFLTETGLTYMQMKSDEEEEEERKEKKKYGDRFEDENFEIEWNRIDMVLKGANIKKENVIKEGESTYFKQYFLGHCPNGISNVHDYEKITITDVYPGIDWVLYNSNEKGFKYDFVVHPNANPNDIELVYLSEKPIKINSNGEIEMKSKIGTITENKPISFLNGENIPTQFFLKYQNKTEVHGDRGYETSVQFAFPDVVFSERNVDLIIDPQLTWATFVSGNGVVGTMSLDTDVFGNSFTTGYISSISYPLQNAGTYFQGSSNGGGEMFITKFNAVGALVWSTYFGGSQSEFPNFINSDNNGNIFITGWTDSPDFPIQNSGNYFQPNLSFTDAFIIKFNGSGTLIWSTFYGGSGYENGQCIAFDNNNNILVTGLTNSSNLPVLNSGNFFQGTINGGNDLFIVKFSSTGILLWATYYGGSGFDYGNGICADNFGNIYIAGSTTSTDLPIQNNNTFFQNVSGGGSDGFVLKFSSSGVLLWATYFGGNLGDECVSLEADATGNLFITGITRSTNFPVLNFGGFFQGILGGGSDVFVTKFSTNGSLLWSSYIGSSGIERMGNKDNLVLDQCGNVYISFDTNSNNNLPVFNECSSCYCDSSLTGLRDVFLIKFSNSSTLLWGTYLGGDGEDFREPISIDNNGSLFVSGEWRYSANYPVVNPGGGAYYNPIGSGMDDSFMARFSPVSSIANITVSTCAYTSTSVNVSLQTCISNIVYTLQPGNLIQSNPVFNFTLNNTTTYTVFGSGLNASNAIVTNTTIVTVSVIPSPSSSPILLYGSCNNLVPSSINLNITFNPNGNPNYTTIWSPLPNTVTTINSPTAAGLIPGLNSVTITTEHGCKTVVSFSVPPIPLPADFIITNSSNDYTITCSNPNVLLTTSVTNGVPLSYTWFPSCTNTLIGTSMNFTQACNGIVIGTSSTGCTHTETFTIYSNFNLPTVAVTPTVLNITCSLTPSTFTGTSNMSPNVITNWFQIVGTNTMYVGASGGTVNIFQPGQPGIYWFESVNTITGCKTTMSVQVTSSIGVPIFTVTSPSNFTVGCSTKSITSLQITTVVTSPTLNVPCQYAFVPPPGTATPVFSSTVNINNTPLVGTWVVYVKDQTNNCISSQSISIIQNTIQPNINFIQPLSILNCREPSMVLNGISSNSNTSITWTVPAPPSSSVFPAANVTVTILPGVSNATNNVTTIGVYTVGAVDNNNLCRASKTVQINQDIRLPKFTLTAGSNSVINCKNTDVLIVPVSTGSLAQALVPTYVWIPPVGVSIPGTQYNTTASGIHTTIATSAINGCTYSAMYNVASDFNAPVLTGLGQPFILDCSTNPMVTITPSVVGSTSGLTYSWSVPPGASTSNLNALNLTSNKVGSYIITITNTLNGCLSEAIYQVTEGGIVADFIADPIFGYAPLAVTFTNTSATSTNSSNIISTWGYGNGAVTQTVMNNVITSTTYTAPGTYSVILTVQKGTCIDSEIKTITVELPSKLEVPNVFTPNGDGSNDVFKLRASSLEEVNITIFDRWGTIVYELTSDTGNFAWDGKNQLGKDCASGTFFYVLKAKGKDYQEYELKGNVSLFR